MRTTLVLSAIVFLTGSFSALHAAKPAKAGRSAKAGRIEEFPIKWNSGTTGSTHELSYNRNGGEVFWVTGQNHDRIARVTLDGKANIFKMPDGSRPHGIVFDKEGRLWISLEFHGQVAEIDQKNGEVLRTIDVQLHVKNAAGPINTHPHGLGLDADGETIWFTGKNTSTVGRINTDGTVEHFALPTIGSVPIYLATGPDGTMWGTELVGNKILRVDSKGHVTEFSIPTWNSRPIAIVPGPDGKSMWFSEETGNKVGRITLSGKITEFPIPLTQQNVILAGMAFDNEGNLWTHSYVNQHDADPPGTDHIIKLDKSIQRAKSGDISRIPVTYYQTPTRNTVMHRITQGPDGNIWFTELGVDKLGKLITASRKSR